MKNKLRYPVTLLLVFAIGIVTFLITLHFGPQHASPPIKPTTAQATPAVAVVEPPPSVRIIQQRMSSNELERTLAALRANLQQWRDSEVDDPDNESGRAEWLQEMLAMVTDANVAEIVQSLTPAEMNTPFGEGALHHWMQTDPLSASNWVMSRSDATDDEILTVAGDWAGNPNGLQQYIDKLPDSTSKQTFLQDASSEISFKDPSNAVELAQQMEPGDARTNLFRAVVSGWIGTDPNAALNYIASINDPSMREQMLASATQAYAQTDPALAASWLVSQVKSPEIVNDSALNILSTWVITDPIGAANWANQFPEGDTKAEAIKIVSTHWYQTDPQAAEAWIQSLTAAATPGR